ncbi:MAG: NUDIX domain-containing protein, partial [Planctomycetota bacterium]
LHGTWGFPKGHLDGDESEEDGARRELLEETGLREITVIPGFDDRSAYLVRHPKRGRYHKDVVYFLARLDGGEVRRSDEHDEVRWVDLSEALETLQWDELRRTLLAAHTHLKSHPPEETP